MPRQRGPWTVLESVERFHNDFFEVKEDRVLRPDGQPGTYATVQMKPGACVLPIGGDGRVYLTHQFRYALGDNSIEVVAGGIDAGESPLAAAQRELIEELGIEAASWESAGEVALDTSIATAPAHLFIARKLTFRQAHVEATETIAVLKLPLAEAIEKVERGEIRHAATVILLLRAARLEGI